MFDYIPMAGTGRCVRRVPRQMDERMKKNTTRKPVASRSAKTLHVVTTISVFAHQYLVDAPTIADAERLIQERLHNDEGVIEWTQRHVSEEIIDTRTQSVSEVAAAHTRTGVGGTPWVPVNTLINR